MTEQPKEKTTFETRPIRDLVPYDRNARLHSQQQLDEIAASIEAFGFTNPLLIDGANRIIAGHGRMAAAQLLGMTEVPVLVLRHLTDRQRRQYIIADNRLAEKATWDEEMLAEELTAIAEEGDDLALTGFSEAELADMMADDDGEKPEKSTPDPTADLVKKWPVERGQLWKIGSHRLLCGDATSAEDIETLMGGRRAAMVFTDPPYGVSYESAAGHKKIRGDDLRDDKLVQLLLPALRNAAKVTADTGAFYIWHASATRAEFDYAMTAAGLVEIQQIIWAKPSAALGRSDYHWAWEPCYYAAKDGHRPKFYGDRTNTNLWRVATGGGDHGVTIGNGVLLTDGEGGQLWVDRKPPSSRSKIRKVRLSEDGSVGLAGEGAGGNLWEVKRDTGYAHPTQKPVELGRRAMANSCGAGGIVFDPFLGSGSTMQAAEELARTCYGTEISPEYCAVILERMSLMGLEPELAE